ncbi:unnamed protein product [Oppiella nova]|uniref:SET domain-containing protein n=1 Tax=Oppiella nova TaxID=334625 RepID=A0A7R9M615_9ACAR|nr:unnamed protein product [Oppiella nova]CAG2170898.1 unnamed protein product [Oppiella nova]
MYCSRKCQTESAANDMHSHECPILATRPLSCMTRLIARIIKRLETTGATNEYEVIGTHKRDWDCLMDHYENITKDFSVMREFELIYNDLALIFGDNMPDINTTLSIYGKLLINSFAVQDPFMRQIGRAIYLGPSIFDHSCKPTANFLFIGTTLYIKAIKSVNISDIRDLRISYIDEFETTVDRQRQLSGSYYFHCDCERCLTNESIVSMSEDKGLRPICETIEKLSNECNYFTDSTGSSTQRRLYASAVQNDNNMIHELAAQLRRDVMPLNTVLEVRVAEFVAIHDKDLDLWLKVMAILRSYYGDCHQRLALKLYLLAKNADNYPTLKRQLLTEAKTIAKYITPDLGQQTAGAMRSRAIHRSPLDICILISH